MFSDSQEEWDGEATHSEIDDDEATHSEFEEDDEEKIDDMVPSSRYPLREGDNARKKVRRDDFVDSCGVRFQVGRKGKRTKIREWHVAVVNIIL